MMVVVVGLVVVVVVGLVGDSGDGLLTPGPRSLALTGTGVDDYGSVASLKRRCHILSISAHIFESSVLLNMSTYFCMHACTHLI